MAPLQCFLGISKTDHQTPICRLNISKTENRSLGWLRFVFMLGVCERVEAAAEGGADEVQDQVIHVAGAPEGHHLAQLHQADDRGTDRQRPLGLAQPGEHRPQQIPQGDEQDNISCQIDRCQPYQRGPGMRQ